MWVTILVANGIPWLIPGLSLRGFITLTVASLTAVLMGFWRAGWLGARFHIQQVIWDSAGAWWLVDRQGCRAAVLRPDSIACKYFIWLKWKCEGSPAQVLMFRSDCKPAEWRRWLTRLYLEAGRAQPDAAAGPI